MILPFVSELLAQIARRPAIGEACDRIRRDAGEVRIAGLSDSAKALVMPLVFRETGHPAILVVDSNARAEAFLEPIRWCYRAITGKQGRRVAHLPAYEVLPYEGRSPHAEIAEARAVALWRLASGEIDLLIAPVQAVLWRMHDASFYRELARTVARDESIAHQGLIGFLNRAGYEKQTSCEMPGEYAVRGGIIDVFSPEAAQPVRIELLGDTIESIRAFDANTQRSTSPVERATLLPLSEFVLGAETLARQGVAAGTHAEEVDSGREDQGLPPGYFSGWEFREIPRERRSGVLFDLANDAVVLEVEPSLLEAAIEKYRKRMAEAFDEAEDAIAQPPNRYILDDEEWELARQMAPHLSMEQLGIAGGSAAQLTLQTRPTTRHHGNVPGFIEEVRGRLSAGEHVIASAASTGELERFADICHEYELPYRIGELEENVTVARLAEEGSTTGGG